MGYTVSELLTQAAKRYGDLNDGGSLGLTLAQQTHDDLCIKCRIAQTSRDIAITVNNPTITVPATVMRVWNVEYVRSSATEDVKRLEMRSFRWMDEYRPNWRNRSGDEPVYALVDNTVANLRDIRLWRTPILGSSPTYPLIRLHTTEKRTLVTAAPAAGEISSLPEAVDSLRPYLEGIWWRFSQLYAPENQAEHKQRYDEAINELNGNLKLFMADDIPMMAPGWAQVGRPTT